MNTKEKLGNVVDLIRDIDNCSGTFTRQLIADEAIKILNKIIDSDDPISPVKVTPDAKNGLKFFYVYADGMTTISSNSDGVIGPIQFADTDTAAKVRLIVDSLYNELSAATAKITKYEKLFSSDVRSEIRKMFEGRYDDHGVILYNGTRYESGIIEDHWQQFKAGATAVIRRYKELSK